MVMGVPRICQWVMIDPLDDDVSKLHPDLRFAMGMKIRGKVFNHPIIKNGAIETTAIVLGVIGEGRVFETIKGEQFLIGSPAAL